MAKLSSHTTAPVVKALLIGDGGSGKTGALVSLAKAGYNLWVVDFDNGKDILYNLGKSAGVLDKIDVETFRDEFHMVGQALLPKKAVAWNDAIKHLGSIVKTLGPDDVLVLDSLSFAGKSALRYVMGLGGRLATKAQLQDWGDAQSMIENLVAMLTDDDLKTNVICTAHIQWLEGEGEQVMRGLPSMPGKALSPVIGRYFNHTLAVRSVGQGQAMKRKIHTSPIANLELKNTNPAAVKPDYPLETGLAEYFAATRGTAPSK